MEVAYKLATGFDSVNAGNNVWNLLNKKDFKLKNGIYSFKGQGPHFPRLIFIYKNGAIYTFNTAGTFDPKGVIQDYLKCTIELQLTDADIRRYLNMISQYLNEEAGETYGAEIKNE